MEHQSKEGHGLPLPEGPQKVWQSLQQKEELGMEMRLSTEELCAKARFRERENVWFQWLIALHCLGLGAFFIYWVLTLEQIWLRLASAWMVILLAFLMWVGIRVGARRTQAGESCAQFMLRELEGSRQTALAFQRGFVLVMPAALMAGIGRAEGESGIWRTIAVLLVLSLCAAGLGDSASKKARQAEELRRAMEGKG